MRKESWDLIARINKWWLCFAINLCLIIGVVVFATPVYETNDDLSMVVVAAGFYGGYSEYLIFLHIFLGKFIKILFAIIPSINWYIWLLYGLQLLAWTNLCNVFLDKFKYRVGAGLCAVIMGLFIVESYISVQFTKTAVILALCGMITFVHFIRQKRWGMSIMGIILVVIGSMYRFEGALIGVAFTGVFVLFEAFRDEKNILSLKFWKNNRALILMLLCISGCSVGLSVLNDMIYQSNEEWAHYYEYNHYRGEIQDFGMASYAEYSEEYQAIGVSANDLEMLRNLTQADSEFFTAERLMAIDEVGGDKIDNFEINWKYFFKEYMMKGFQNTVLLFFIVAGLIVFCFGNRMERMVVGYVLFVMYGLITYFVGVNRLPWRVEYGVILSAFVAVLYGIDASRMKRYAWQCAVFGTFLGVWYATFFYSQRMEFNSQVATVQAQESIFSYISQDEDHYYLFDIFSGDGNYEFHYDILKVPPKELHENSSYLGGWSTESGYLNYHLKLNGIENPVKDLLENENLRYIANSGDTGAVQRMETYLAEHYGEEGVTYQLEVVDTYNQSNIYKLNKVK